MDPNESSGYVADSMATSYILFALSKASWALVYSLYLAGVQLWVHTTIAAHHGPSQQNDEFILTVENMIM